MIRLILISLISVSLFSLTACSDEKETASQTTESHSENKNHSDNEHHDEKKEQGHDDHDDGDKHDEKEGEHEEEAGAIHLKPEQMKAANIVVKALQISDTAVTVRAPGEVKLNAYRTIKVSPRINAQIINRHAKLGDEVTEGQKIGRAHV